MPKDRLVEPEVGIDVRHLARFGLEEGQMIVALLVPADRIGELAIVPLAAGEDLRAMFLERGVKAGLHPVRVRSHLGRVEKKQALVAGHRHV
jgi:hypothetical protein